MLPKKKSIFLLVFLLGCFLCACEKEETMIGESLVEDKEEVSFTEETKNIEEEAEEQWNKGYDLLIDEEEREEAETDCRVMMDCIYDIYKEADKGTALNVVLTDETVFAMQGKLKDTGYPVTTTVMYSNMENYESVDSFLEHCMAGKRDSIIIYEIHVDGGIGRMKFAFDGTDMYVLNTRIMWNKNESCISYMSYNRIKEWKYTDKGWFGYQVCVPEPPEVTEIVDGSRLIRIKPMTEEQREMSIKCVQNVGYQGNNLLCSNWDSTCMEKLDYNGIYEYFYWMKYKERLDIEQYSDGIPQKEFEELMMEYLPVTVEEIRKYAVFDEDNQKYEWSRLGCLTYDLSYFGTAVPEVTNVKRNEDGTVTLTVDALCDMVICDDAVITHELTVMFAEDGSFRYLGNEILNDGIKQIPEYRYRIIE